MSAHNRWPLISAVLSILAILLILFLDSLGGVTNAPATITPRGIAKGTHAVIKLPSKWTSTATNAQATVVASTSQPSPSSSPPPGATTILPQQEKEEDEDGGKKPTLTSPPETQTPTPAIIHFPRQEAEANCNGGYFNLETTVKARFAFVVGKGEEPECHSQEGRSCTYEEWRSVGKVKHEEEVERTYIQWGFIWKDLKVNPKPLDWAMYVWQFWYENGRSQPQTWVFSLDCNSSNPGETSTESPTPLPSETEVPASVH